MDANRVRVAWRTSSGCICLFWAGPANGVNLRREIPAGPKPERKGKSHPDQFALWGGLSRRNRLHFVLRPHESERPGLREGLRVSDARHDARIQDAKLAAGRPALQAQQ